MNTSCGSSTLWVFCFPTRSSAPPENSSVRLSCSTLVRRATSGGGGRVSSVFVDAISSVKRLMKLKVLKSEVGFELGARYYVVCESREMQAFWQRKHFTFLFFFPYKKLSLASLQFRNQYIIAQSIA